MVTFNLTDPELVTQFENAVIKDMGYKRGNKKKAIIKAVKLYIDEVNARGN
jgi:hypothetical protein